MSIQTSAVTFRVTDAADVAFLRSFCAENLLDIRVCPNHVSTRVEVSTTRPDRRRALAVLTKRVG